MSVAICCSAVQGLEVVDCQQHRMPKHMGSCQKLFASVKQPSLLLLLTQLFQEGGKHVWGESMILDAYGNEIA
jgi:hypothetical protein